MKFIAQHIRNTCLLLSLLVLGQWALAQSGVIKGQVQHKGSPLEFITVKLNDVHGNLVNCTLSDENGTFEFKDLEPGAYTLIGSHEGYSLQSKLILGRDEQIIITLSPNLFRWIPAPPPPTEFHLILTLAETPAFIVG